MQQPYSPYPAGWQPEWWQPPTPEQLEYMQCQQRRKKIRGRTNRVTAMVFLYLAILSIGAGLGSLLPRLINQFSTTQGLQQLLSDMLSGLTDSLNSGLGYLLALPGVLLMLFLWKKRPFFRNVLFARHRKIQPGRLLFLISLLFLAQAGADLLDRAATFLWQGIGLPEHGGEIETGDSVSMLLYVCIGAPVVEELLFRGGVLRSFQNFGKLFAIVASSVLFSVMHGTFSQIPFAFAAGIVLGYTAVEYSVWWSIFLHFFNNCILATVLPKICELLPYGQWIYLGMIYCVALAALLACVLQRRKLCAYRRQNAILRGSMGGFFSAPVLIAMLCYGFGSACLLEIFSMLA